MLFKYWRATIRSPRSLLFSRLNSPNSLSPSLQKRCSIPLISFVSLLWPHSNRSVSFLCWGLQSWTQHTRQALTWTEYRGRIPSLNLLATLLLMQPRIRLAFWAASTCCWVMLSFSSTSKVLLSKAALYPFVPQPVLIVGVSMTHVQDPAVGLVELHEVHMGLLLKLFPGPLGGIPFVQPVNYTTQVVVICKLAEGTLDPAV